MVDRPLNGRGGGRFQAWAIHVLTASGVVFGLLSLSAIQRGDAPWALIWLGVALVVDGFDGPLARRYRVDEVLPRVDGAILDHVIDYVTYALIPALFIYRFELMPAGWDMAAAAYIMVTSLYCFANKDLKTQDNFFTGFPAAWNLVVVHMHIVASSPGLNLAVVAALGVLTFVPVKFIHPCRVAFLRPVTIPLTVVWSLLGLYLILASAGARDLAAASPLAFWSFLAISAYLVAISILRSAWGRLS